MFRQLATAVIVLGAIGPLAGVPAVRADVVPGRRDVTVMTQNIYQGSELEHVLAATSLAQFITGAATDYNNVIATNFSERADALAAEIAQSRPALVGLQEVALWRTQEPFVPGTVAQTVSFDFLQILLDALSGHGQHYTVVVARDNFDVSGPALFPAGLKGVRLTERSVVIARTDLPSDALQLSNPQQGGYQHVSVLPTLTGPFPLGAGWLSVDAKVRGKSFRFITTHLDGFSTAVAAQQLQEMLDGPAATGLPVVATGDFNSQTTDAAYARAVAAGFVDQWSTGHPGEPGLTCCQVPPDTIVNPISQLSTRIDYVFARGLLAPVNQQLLGADPSSRTASGLWPSDHAGLVATLVIGPGAGLTP